MIVPVYETVNKAQFPWKEPNAPEKLLKKKHASAMRDPLSMQSAHVEGMAAAIPKDRTFADTGAAFCNSTYAKILNSSERLASMRLTA